MSSNPYRDLIENPNAEVEPPPPLSDAPTATNPYRQLIETPANIPQPKPSGPPPGFNVPFGELRPAEYSFREKLGNLGQDALMKLGAQPYVAGRVARGTLDAASLIPPVGATISGIDTGLAAQRGDPFMAGVNALGMIPGATAGRRAISGMPQRALAPEEAQLRSAKNFGYDMWEQSPVRYSPQMMDDATNHVALALRNESNPAAHPGVWGALDHGRSLKTQTGMTNLDFETMRRQWQNVKPEERGAARTAINALEDYMANVPQQHIRTGTPADVALDRQLLLNARGNTAALKRSEVISNAENIAELKSQRGKDFSDVLGSKIEALETTKSGRKTIRSYTDEEVEAARNAITDKMTRRMENVGAAATKFGTAGAMIPGAGGGALVGHQFGFDPYTTGAVGLASQGLAYGTGRALTEAAGNRMRNQVAEAAANLRMRSPMAQAPGSPYERVADPVAQAQDARKYLMYPWLRQEGEDYIEGQRTPFEYR